MNQYTAFASVYDKMMHDVDRDAWIAYLDVFLKKANAVDVMDCACGTGINAISLRQRGYHVTGSDVSSDMLSEARNNALLSGARDIVFICEDMRKLKVHKPIDAIVCVCDGVNYLTSMKDESSFFEHANACLKPGGLLLFDVSTPFKFKKILGTNTFTEETDRYAYIWRNNYDARSKLCEMNLTFFTERDGRYDRFSEVHLQRAHSTEELKRALEKNGFCDICIYDAFTQDPLKTNSERAQFAAVKEK